MSGPDSFILNFTPTGMLPTREQSPFVPLSPPEIIADVLAAVEIGITSVHLHVRNPQTGQPDYRSELYAEVINGIRRYAPELVIIVSLSGRFDNLIEHRSAPLQLTGAEKTGYGQPDVEFAEFQPLCKRQRPRYHHRVGGIDAAISDQAGARSF